mgnify:CR=1 FL=1
MIVNDVDEESELVPDAATSLKQTDTERLIKSDDKNSDDPVVLESDKIEKIVNEQHEPAIVAAQIQLKQQKKQRLDSAIGEHKLLNTVSTGLIFNGGDGR